MSVVPYKWLSFKMKYYEVMEKYQIKMEEVSEQLFLMDGKSKDEKQLLYKQRGELQIVQNIFSQFQHASLFYRYFDLPLSEIEKRVEEKISEREEIYQRGMVPYYEEILFCACLQDELNYIRSFFASILEEEQLEKLVEEGDLRKEEKLPTSDAVLQARNQFIFRNLEAIMRTYFRKSSVVSVDQKTTWKQILSDREELDNPSFSGVEQKFIEEMGEWLEQRISQLVRRIKLYQIRNSNEIEFLNWGKDKYISHDKDGMWTFLLSPLEQQKKGQLEFCVEQFRLSLLWEEQVMTFHRDFLQEEDLSENWYQFSLTEKTQILEKDLRSFRRQIRPYSDFSCHRRRVQGEIVSFSMTKRKRERPLEVKERSILGPRIDYAECCKNLLHYYRQPHAFLSPEDRTIFLELFEMVHPKSEEVTHRPVEKVKKCL